MTTVVRGGSVFDVRSGSFSPGDVGLDGELIGGVGSGLSAETDFDASGLSVLPGLIDTHVHVMVGTFDLVNLLETPFSYFFYAALKSLSRTLDVGIILEQKASRPRSSTHD